MTNRLYTIVAITGDTGMEHAIGRFNSLEAANVVATELHDRDNPNREPDGVSYGAVRIQTIKEWNSND